MGSQLNFLFSVFRDTIAIGKKHAFLNARPHHFRTSTLDAISNASERLKSARFRKYGDDSDPVIKLKRKSDINQNSAQEPTSVATIQWRGFNPINAESSRTLTHSLYPIALNEV